MKRIILASASPRRKELLSRICASFEVIPSDADEAFDPSAACAENVRNIALAKALAVVRAGGVAAGDCVVIGADTVVSIDGEPLGKPRDADDAARMLARLSGRAHTVFTGYAAVRGSDGKTEAGVEETTVLFRELSGGEIAEYIKTGEPMDKAGAYGVQGIGAIFITRIEGDYSNVMGLPLCRMALTLRKFGVDILKQKEIL
ncbi:MAG: Maf family protein [Clostridiales bacterium]|jgi:septum formation protein|nr:Maf family protein [Clostridiales bacterium]